MGLLEDGEEALRQWRSAYLTVDATYNGAAVKVSQGATMADTELQSGLIVNSKTVDWLIDRDQLPGPPKSGDIIVVAGVTYQAMALNGERVWRYHGRNNTTYRIHSKAV